MYMMVCSISFHSFIHSLVQKDNESNFSSILRSPSGGIRRELNKKRGVILNCNELIRIVSEGGITSNIHVTIMSMNRQIDSACLT
uniref:Uncharacterized protein n=1 Tax=Megaselia scalaris TaxID=36166 RepID=T1GU65_MEGSC